MRRTTTPSKTQMTFLVYGFPIDYSPKDLVLRLGIMPTESVPNSFPGAFDVRRLRDSCFVSIEH